jgi:hypothetical protein
MNKYVRHWWIQKPISNNVPLLNRGAVFEEFRPTIQEQGCEWIKVFSADDFHAHVNINITRYIELCKRLAFAESMLERAKKHFNSGPPGTIDEFYAVHRPSQRQWLEDLESGGEE